MRQYSSYKLFDKSTTWCLLVLVYVLMQFLALSHCQSSESGSIITETCSDCKPGEVCDTLDDGTSLCQKKECHFNCTDEKKHICGSNGITYKNQCELEKARCELNTDIDIEYSDECITLPPPPEPLCKKKQEAFDSLSSHQTRQMCNRAEINAKAKDGTLKLADVLECYRPRCHANKFRPKQCSYVSRKWCWCSSSDGLAMNGTLQKNMKASTCSNRKTCDYGGQIYQDGEVFSPPSGCGLCQCLNGIHSCFENYVPQPNGTLTENQLTQLKEEVLNVFLIQYNHREHVLVDIRHIHQYPSQVSEFLRSEILRWKFDHYDRNRDSILSAPEQFLFQMDLFDFVRCKSFFDHVSEVMDLTNDRHISRYEWTAFFAEELIEYSSTSGQTSTSLKSSSLLSAGLGKRSVYVESVGRKASNRKKFHYTLF